MISASEKSLYARLGGYDAVARFVDDLIPRLTTDPEIGVYWTGHCTNSMRRERQMIVDFLCEALGGPVVYRGRDMRTSHEGLDISADFRRTQSRASTVVPLWQDSLIL